MLFRSRWLFLLNFAAHDWVVANGPNFIKTLILMYDFLCCLAHCVKKMEFLSTQVLHMYCFLLKMWGMALFEIDKFQIPFSASEGALLFFFFFLLVLFPFCFCFLFCFVFVFLSMFSAMLNSPILLNLIPTLMPRG